MYLSSRRLTLARFPSMTETCHRFFHLNTTELDRLNFFLFLAECFVMIKATGAVFFCASKKPNPKQSLASNQNKGLHHRKQFGIALLSLLGAESASNAGRRKQPRRLCFIFAPDCLRKWREVSGPITRNRERFKRGKT